MRTMSHLRLQSYRSTEPPRPTNLDTRDAAVSTNLEAAFRAGEGYEDRPSQRSAAVCTAITFLGMIAIGVVMGLWQLFHSLAGLVGVGL